MVTAIRTDNVSKCYPITHQGKHGHYRTLREALVGLAAAPLRRLCGQGDPDRKENFWALKDVSFEVQPGEVLGIIGRNGAGKSTLLKVLSRITKPTHGEVQLRGRIGSLLEVGTGFHPELTGRENIYLNGSILGMGRKEIERRFDEIVAFAEIERFLDTPVKRYSSGMYVRLAFAVAAYLESEILVVDEVLAVGDLEFQKKCLRKIGEIGRDHRTVLLVSHNMNAIARLTTRTLLLERGLVAGHGKTADVISKYLASCGAEKAEWVRPEGTPARRGVTLTRVRCADELGHTRAHHDADRPLIIEIQFTVSEKAEAQIAFRVNKTSDCETIFTTAHADHTHQFGTHFVPGDYRALCVIPGHLLVPGSYHILVAANNQRGPQFDMIERAVDLEITPIGSLTCIEQRLGAVAPLCDWHIGPSGRESETNGVCGIHDDNS
jgi:lipopolysaccharide transport system ATP-binding protein